jgi:hypothetical protein
LYIPSSGEFDIQDFSTNSSTKKYLTFDRRITSLRINNASLHIFKKIKISSGYNSILPDALEIFDTNPLFRTNASVANTSTANTSGTNTSAANTNDFDEIILPNYFPDINNINKTKFPIVSIADEENDIASEYEFITLKNNNTIRIPKSKVLGRIDFLLENEVFVFGSNSSGQHKGGAAKTANDNG